MNNLSEIFDLSVEIIEDLNKILKFIQIGTHIPIWKEFHKYILYDFNYFKVKLLLLKEGGYAIGTCLIFNIDRENLCFGYFRILDHEKEKIEFLINYLIDYSKKKGFTTIIGPINIPIIIFGWGFMKKGSSNSLCITKSINPPEYLELFFKKGFKTKLEEKTWEAYPTKKYNPWKLKDYNFDDYVYFYPKNFNEFLALKETFIRLHARNLPPSSRITPNSDELTENYVKFVFEFGFNAMLPFVKHKPSNKIIACASFIPDPFRQTESYKTDTFIIFTWLVDKEHREKGLIRLIYGATLMELWDKGIRNTLGTIAVSNIPSTQVAKNLYGISTRVHDLLIFSF